MYKYTTFTGEEILYSGDDTHFYTDLDGNLLVSASTFPKQFFKPFDREGIAQRVALQHNVPVDAVLDMWQTTADVSSGFGNAVHNMMERHFRYRGNPAYKLPNHTFLQEILTSFPRFNQDGLILPEEYLSCVARRMVGKCDAIYILDPKARIAEVWDYKTSYDISKDLEKYKIQINYYAKMLEFHGWKITRRYIYNYGCDGWQEIEVERIDLSKLRPWTG